MDDAPQTPASRPAISFAIPYYRGIDYLREAIDSVVAQTVDDWELVVVDDQGPEPAEQLVASYDDARISYVRNTRNLGLAGNWNECVRLSRAPWVNVLHGDDRLLPHYARTVLAATAANPDTAVIFTDAFNIDAAGERTRTLADLVKEHLPRRSDDHRLEGDADLAGLLFGNYIICPSMLLQRAVVGTTPFRDGLRFVPDWEFTTRLLLEGHALFAVRKPLIEYRRHSKTETSLLTSDSSRFIEEIQLLRQRQADCASRGLDRSARTARRRVTARGHIVVRAAFDMVAGRWAAARSKWRILWSDVRGLDVGMDDPDPQ